MKATIQLERSGLPAADNEELKRLKEAFMRLMEERLKIGGEGEAIVLDISPEDLAEWMFDQMFSPKSVRPVAVR